MRVFALMGFVVIFSCVDDSGAQVPPKTKMLPVTDTVHGEEMIDQYRWLEDQQSPATRAWIDEQNAYTDAVIEKIPGRTELSLLLEKLMKVEATGTPRVRGNLHFYMRRKAGEDLQSLCMKDGFAGEEVVLIDPQTLSADGSISVSFLDVSLDGKLIVYGLRKGGEDEVSLAFFDVETHKPLELEFPRARYFGVTLSRDAKELFYTKHGEEGSRVFRYQFGKSAISAQEIFGNKYGPGEIVSPSLSHDRNFLLIHVYYGSAAKQVDVYFQNLKTGGEIRPLVNDVEAQFEAQAIDHRVYLQTDLNAPRGRVLAVNLHHPERQHWKEIIPQTEAVLQGFSLVGGKLFVNTLANVNSKLAVYDAGGHKLRSISFPSLGTVSGVSGRWDSPHAYYSFSSFHIPTTIYRENVHTHQRELWAKVDVPVNSENFQLSQHWATSKDGTKIPMFILHQKDFQPTGETPTVLYGYGGFNVSLTPSFSPRIVSWVKMGGVFVVSNLRGGGEFGEDWHRAGMQEKKQNVFDDFRACAQWLIDNNYTKPEKLAVSGGSNGGLLVGAAITQFPELIRAIVCSYPLLDMVRYHQFLVARFWVPEYGSSEDQKQFETLRKYSPYHNVKFGEKYPAALFITGDADTRVDPLHARKMAALMQAATTSKNPILLHYDTKAGHSHGRPVSHQIEDLTLELSFLRSQLGLDEASSTATEAP